MQRKTFFAVNIESNLVQDVSFLSYCSKPIPELKEDISLMTGNSKMQILNH